MTEPAKYDYPDKLVQIITGGINSAIFKIAIDLHVFNKMDGNSISMEEFSKLLGIPLSSSRVFTQYLCMLDLLKYQDGKLQNSPLAQEYLLKYDNDDWIKDLLAVSEENADGLKNKILSPPAQDWYQIRDKGENVNESFFKGWLHERRISWGEKLSKQYDFSGHHTLLDIGGACGGWCLGIRKNFPHLKCIIFDIPPVCQIVDKIIKKTEMLSIVPGSFFKNNLPNGADIVLLANVLHDWSYADGRKILSNIHKILPSQGILLVSEFYFKNDFSGPAWAALQALSVLGPDKKSGWQPTYEEISDMLLEEKFTVLGQKKDLIIAQK